MKSKFRFPTTRLFMATIIISNIALADDDPNARHYKLDSVVTTGSPLATEIAKIPGNITAISEKQINEHVNSKISDVVKKAVGVRIDNDVSFNPRPKIKIRGINYGTLIMLDGVILSDLEGENRVINQISLYDVKRVEIARGAYSSLYGTNALGGVINFITSMPKGLEIEGVAGYGNEIVSNSAERNLSRFYLSIGNTFFDNRFRIKLSGGMNNSQGYVSTPVFLSTKPNNYSGGFYDKSGKYIVGDEGRREWQIWDSRLKMEYDIDDTSTVSSMFSLSNHNYEFVNPTTLLRNSSGMPVYDIAMSNNTTSPFVGSGYGGHGSYTHFIGNISYMKYFDESELKVSLSSVNLFSRWADGLSGATLGGGNGYTQDINTSSNYLDLIYHWHVNDTHSIAFATQFRYLNFDAIYYTLSDWRNVYSVNGKQRGYGAMGFVASGYVNWEAKWLDNLSSTLGIRYDYWLDFNSYVFGNIASNLPSNHTSQFSPKASINYQPFDFLLLKASVGSGFRMPTIREKYQDSHGVTKWQYSPALKPEVGISFELGGELKLDDVSASLYYFQTDLFDMIYRQGAGNDASPFRYANAGYGRINGIELSLSVPIFQSLRFEGNYTLTLARVLRNSANPASVGKQLIDTPEHIANIGLIYGESKGIYASLDAFFTSAFYNDDINSKPLYRTFGEYDAQFSLNAKVGYIFQNGFDISLSLLNITNNRYYDFYQVAGASFYVQGRYKFVK